MTPRAGAAFQCNTTRVEKRTMEIDYRPRLGVLAPVDGHLITRLTWSDVPLGDRLVGWSGLHDYYARKNSDAPVPFKVYVDGELVVDRVARNSDAWLRFEVDTAAIRARKPAPTATIRFELSSPAPQWRNLGFHAETRSARATEGTP